MATTTTKLCNLPVTDRNMQEIRTMGILVGDGHHSNQVLKFTSAVTDENLCNKLGPWKEEASDGHSRHHVLKFPID